MYCFTMILHYVKFLGHKLDVVAITASILKQKLPLIQGHKVDSYMRVHVN